ncbi:hypothetical protein Zmor_002041 [Zophobas morio]|uniref:Uncharacterized protein n=1 Tax=Zophobas morio TaxID=2755281 RepID=A0AA38MPS2_9CUCU|nr:hypothetical protein Zmor_002041 [Zophobas morio]
MVDFVNSAVPFPRNSPSIKLKVGVKRTIIARIKSLTFKLRILPYLSAVTIRTPPPPSPQRDITADRWRTRGRLLLSWRAFYCNIYLFVRHIVSAEA